MINVTFVYHGLSKYHIIIRHSDENSFHNHSNIHICSLWSFKGVMSIILSAFGGIFSLKPQIVWVTISRQRQNLSFLYETNNSDFDNQIIKFKLHCTLHRNFLYIIQSSKQNINILSNDKKFPCFHAWVYRGENTMLLNAYLATLTIWLCRMAVHFGFLSKRWNKRCFKHKK